MPTANDVLQGLVDDLTAELLPLDSIYNNFAKYRVEAALDIGGLSLEVHAPERVRILVPKSYQSFPVTFVPWDHTTSLELHSEIDVSQFKHHIYD